MLSINQCSIILNKKDKSFNKDEVGQIRDFLYKLGELGYEMYKLKINNIIKSENMKTIIAYINESDCFEGEENQRQVIQEYCRTNKMALLKYQSDLDRIVKYAKSIEFSGYLVFTRWNKLSENIDELWDIILKVHRMGIKIICIEQPVNTKGAFSKLLIHSHLLCPFWHDKDEEDVLHN